MFKKVLIANRGEIALRVICACKELGIRTVAVYSEADATTLPVRFADEAVCIGPAKPSASYLNIPSVISAAEITGADAIHPGYGFLSENASFAEVCSTCGITFIGPTPDLIRFSTDRPRVRQRMREAGLLVVPSSEGSVHSLEDAMDWAQRIGYPVRVRPAIGSNGRGAHIASTPEELAPAFDEARHDSLERYGSDDVYLERALSSVRILEFPFIADHHGGVLMLPERDCSIQRGNYRLVEEGPSPALRPEQREEITRSLQRVVAESGYTNIGSMKFLMDDQGCLHFSEMTARIQAGHPITEMLTGLDLVKMQILLALGAKVGEIAGPITVTGHSIANAIRAENPETFAPSAGKIRTFHVPGGAGVRVDATCHHEYMMQPFYDSLIAKVIVHGRDRDEAIRRMGRALDMFIVEGVETSLPLHRRILSDPDFISGRYDSSFMDRYQPRHGYVRSAS